MLNSHFLPIFFSGVRILFEMLMLTNIKRIQHKINGYKHEPIMIYKFLSFGANELYLRRNLHIENCTHK